MNISIEVLQIFAATGWATAISLALTIRVLRRKLAYCNGNVRIMYRVLKKAGYKISFTGGPPNER